MRFIKVSMTDLELARVPLNRPVIVIGRSPSCDVVLRTKEVRPIHFILEWIGQGSFDASAESAVGPWSLIEFGPAPVHSRSDILNAATGEGVIVGEEPVVFGGFRFEPAHDRLAATELPGGHMLDNVVAEESSRRNFQLGGMDPVLELIIVRHDPSAVADVDHLQLEANHKYTLSTSPLVRVSRAGAAVQVLLDRAGATEILRRGEPVVTKETGAQQTFDMSFDDVIQLRNHDEDMLLRFVPPVDVAPPQREFKTNSMWKWFLASIGLVGGLNYAMDALQPMKVEKAKQSVRMARVEIKEVASNHAAPPPPPPVEKVAAPPPPTPAPAPVAEVAPQKTTTVRADKKDTKLPIRAKKQAPAADPMDLLAALQDKNGAGGNRVDVDDLVTSGAGAQAQTEAGSGIIVRQPPPGLRQSEYMNVSGAKGNLSKAATDIEVDNSLEEETFNAKKNRQFKTGFDGALSDVSFESGGAGETGDGIESVRGGLSRQSVRQTLASVREEVRGCYNKALLTSSKLRGMVVFRWHISPQGRVTSIHLVRTDLKFPTLEDCVQRVIQKTEFDRAKNATPTTVVYPFKFQKTS